MNEQSVRSRVENLLRKNSDPRCHDHEGLHRAEDKLYREVLRACAHGHPEARVMARQALRLREAKFSRWYA